MDDHRRLFESVKKQGGSRTHWQDFDTNLKNDLVTLLEVRRKLQADAPSAAGTPMPTAIREQLDKVNLAIESINKVRRDVAAELEEPSPE